MVEDDDLVRPFVERALTALGYRVPVQQGRLRPDERLLGKPWQRGAGGA